MHHVQREFILPGTHIVGTGFLDAQLLVQSRDDYGIDLLGPTRLDDHWRAREEPALTPTTSRLIGTSNRRPVRPGRRVSAGRRPWIIVGTPSSK
jgi:hypothetical protein